MRFVTEFELTPEHYNTFPEKVIQSYRANSQFKMGNMIAESFGWEERGETTMHGPVTERHTLEIEAFPMDKWIEFKDKIIDESTKGRSNRTNNIMRMFEELESFGKPAGAAKEL